MVKRTLLNIGRQFLRNRPLSTIYHEARLQRAKSRPGSPILVYQMGKVGSSSIFDSLRATILDRPLFHLHFLDMNNIQAAETVLRNRHGSKYNVNRRLLYEGRFVIKHILQRHSGDLKIISLAREPVARNVSSFFHNLDMFVPNCASRYKNGQIGITDIARQYLGSFHEHDVPLNWFDNEMKRVFAIDVFSDENLHYRHGGISIYKRGRVELLVLRAEDIDNLASQALRRFLNIDVVSLKNANVAQDKDYSRVYRDFKRELRLPTEYLSRMYESKYVKHFYSPQEIERFWLHWSR